MKKTECFDISHRRDVVRECEGSPTLCARMGTGGNNVPIVLMDQGGDVMSNEVDKVGTLRAQTHGHEPVVLSENGTDRTVCIDKTPPLKTTTVPCFALAENTIGRQPQNGGNGTGYMIDKCYTLNATGVHAVALGCDDNSAIPIDTMNLTERKGDTNGLGVGNEGDPSYTITKAHSHGVAFNGLVRRLTPVECERLQGFPDNYTRIPYRGKPIEQCPDSPRYKAIGNSWAVPVVRWIGKRIDAALKEATKGK